MLSINDKMEEIFHILSPDSIRFYYLVLMISLGPETPSDEKFAIVLGFFTEDGDPDIERVRAVKTEIANGVKGWNLAEKALSDAKPLKDATSA